MEHDDEVLDKAAWPVGERPTSMTRVIIIDSMAAALALAASAAAEKLDRLRTIAMDEVGGLRERQSNFERDENAYQARAKKEQNMENLRNLAHGKRKHKNRAPGRRFD